MLQNTRVTAFTISDLLRENQQGGGGVTLPLPLTRLGLMILQIFLNTQMICMKNIDKYNPRNENKILIVFDDMIVDMIINKKINSIVSELFVKSKKLKA